MSLRGYDRALQLGPGMAGTEQANRLGPTQEPSYYPPSESDESSKGVRRGLRTVGGTLEASLAQLMEPWAADTAGKLFDDAHQTLNFGPELQPAVPSIRGVRDLSTFGQWATGAGFEVLPQAAAMLPAGVLGGAIGAGLRANVGRAAGLGAASTFVPQSWAAPP